MHRKMQALAGMVFLRPGQKPEVSEDEGVGAGFNGTVYGAMPDVCRAGSHKSIDRDKHFDLVPMGIGNAVVKFLPVEVETGKIAGVGLVAKTAVDRVRTSIDRSAQR